MEECRSTEEVSFALIANSGDARSLAYDALAAVKKGDFVSCEELIAKSDEALLAAHQAQTDLLFREAQGQKTEMSVLLVHAQDHFMTSMLAIELVKEIIELYQDKLGGQK